MRDFENKKISIIGINETGISAALLIKRLGGEVFISDKKNRVQLKEKINILENNDMPYETEGNTERIIEKSGLIVRSFGVPTKIPILETARKREIPIFDELEFSSLLCKAPIVAITGTNGKTTTIEILKLIFQEAGKRVFIAGHNGIPLSSVVLNISKEDIVLLEISCFYLENSGVFGPSISFITNIAPDHLNRYKNFDEYSQIKMKLSSYQDKSDYCVVNLDDPFAEQIIKNNKARKFFISTRKLLDNGICIAGKEILINNKVLCDLNELSIKNTIFYHNILGAIAIALINGVSSNDIKNGICNFRGLEHRFEYFSKMDGIHVINDSKGTNVTATLNALLNSRYPVILILGGINKRLSFNPLREAIKEKVKNVFIYGENRQFLRKVLNAEVPIREMGSLREAVEKSLKLARSGDTILFSPASSAIDSQFKTSEERGQYFKDLLKEKMALTV